MRCKLIGVLALAVCALTAGTASAATTIVRPNGTTSIDPAWAVSPAGAHADAVLADAVTQPAPPSTTGDFLSAGSALGAYTVVTFPAPDLPAASVPSAVTLWFYASVGLPQTLTASLYSGSDLLGFASYGYLFAPTPGWHHISLIPAPSAAQVSQLVLKLRTDWSAGAPPTRVYAAYAQIDASDGPLRGAAALPGSGDSPAPGAGDDGGGDTPGTADATPGGTPLPALAPPVVIVAPPTIELPAQPRAVPVELSCPPDAVRACRGLVRIELLGAAPVRRGHARAARCARGCRVIGQSSFTIAAGGHKPVKVKLRPTAMRLIPRGHAARVRITVTSRDAKGHRASTTSRTVTLQRG